MLELQGCRLHAGLLLLHEYVNVTACKSDQLKECAVLSPAPMFSATESPQQTQSLIYREPSTDLLTGHLHPQPLCQPLKALLLSYTSPLIQCCIGRIAVLGAAGIARL